MNLPHNDRMNTPHWLHQAIARIEADFCRSADTHLIALPLPGWAAHGIDLYLKDESTHPTGSLKHRLARSLFLYALCNGWLAQGTTVVEASSGSTAVSEAYFARLLGLPFIAVMPRSTSAEKVAQIAFYGGRSHFVDHAGEVYAAAQQLADETRASFERIAQSFAGIRDLAARNPWMDADRVGIYGFSAGGYDVVRAMTDSPVFT